MPKSGKLILHESSDQLAKLGKKHLSLPCGKADTLTLFYLNRKHGKDTSRGKGLSTTSDRGQDDDGGCYHLTKEGPGLKIRTELGSERHLSPLTDSRWPALSKIVS